jgi:transcription initiation factor IIE alpha subunit
VDLNNIVGNQEKILLAFYRNINSQNSNETERLRLDRISYLTSVNKSSLKNTLFRMIKAGLIARTEYRDGRGGWSRYTINPKLIKQLTMKGRL